MRHWIPVAVGLLGALTAFATTWWEPVGVTMISRSAEIDRETVQSLRRVPGASVLEELSQVAVSYPQFVSEDDEEVVHAAGELLRGQFSLGSGGLTVGVPFEGGTYLFGQSGGHFDLHSFAIPSLLARAFEITGDDRYLAEAVDYVVDWSRFESSLWIPLGYTFNDHATAARAVVVTEVWRLYRRSSIFDADVAGKYLEYVQRLLKLLQKESLYEYRTNHGVMQCLSLLHLSIAFPSLPDSDPARRVAVDRLQKQFRYYVNGEGVILEHSAGYHVNGVRRLGAAWRYFGLLGLPVPGEMATRYEKSTRLSATLLRPDGSLPIVGDTSDDRYVLPETAEIGQDRIVSQPLHSRSDVNDLQQPVFFAPAAGIAVVWDGLEHWPDAYRMEQAVIHWGNFPSGVHKHADELGISIWGKGIEWVRSVGAWPYDASRMSAIGWRSSNGPHWQGERRTSDRTSSLSAWAFSEEVAFLDLVRKNSNGATIRRQFLKPATGVWATLDSFGSERPYSLVETIWKFSPSLGLRTIDEMTFEVTDGRSVLAIRFAGPGSFAVEGDPAGAASWNDGVIVAGEKVRGPALKVTSGTDIQPIFTVFTVYDRDADVPAGSLEVAWTSPVDWKLRGIFARKAAQEIQRSGERLELRGTDGPESLHLSSALSEASRVAKADAIDAYQEALAYYNDPPFDPLLARRLKVSGAILAALLAHLAAFPIVRKYLPRARTPILAISSLAWLVLSALIGFYYLA